MLWLVRDQVSEDYRCEIHIDIRFYTYWWQIVLIVICDQASAVGFCRSVLNLS